MDRMTLTACLTSWWFLIASHNDLDLMIVGFPFPEIDIGGVSQNDVPALFVIAFDDVVVVIDAENFIFAVALRHSLVGFGTHLTHAED